MDEDEKPPRRRLRRFFVRILLLLRQLRALTLIVFLLFALLFFQSRGRGPRDPNVFSPPNHNAVVFFSRVPLVLGTCVDGQLDENSWTRCSFSSEPSWPLQATPVPSCFFCASPESLKWALPFCAARSCLPFRDPSPASASEVAFLLRPRSITPSHATFTFFSEASRRSQLV